MRDLNNDGDINIHGDFNVIDNSRNEHKLLIHCISEMLLQERLFRQGNIRLEQARKIQRLNPFYALSLFLLIVAAICVAFNGKTDFVTILMGEASLLLGLQTLNLIVKPNAFQVEEKNAVHEINKYLKQRRGE